MAFQYAYAQIQQDNKTVSTIQKWIDPQENVKIQFNLYASIAILKGDKIFFKYNNIAVQNGYLSLKVQFTEDGNYQLISQIRSKENISIALASFNILVPLQPFGSFDVYSIAPLLLPIGLVAIFGAAAIVIFILIVSRRKKRERKPGI